MNQQELRQVQAPIKARYREDPTSALVTMVAEGRLDEAEVACTVETAAGPVRAGLHPSAGGDGSFACSGDMLLQTLAACAGVTLRSVATAMEIAIGGRVRAEGDLDFRGTLGTDREVPVGFKAIRLIFELDAAIPEEKLDRLLELTERYCVVYQTLASGVTITTLRRSASA
jgi:uncharacterized OsmC-like protein